MYAIRSYYGLLGRLRAGKQIDAIRDDVARFQQTGADMLLWQAACIVHDEFKAKALAESYNFV